MVRSITAHQEPVKNVEKRPEAPLSINSKRPFQRHERVGETESFIVDFDRLYKRTFIYGKEIPWGCPYKIRLGMRETEEIVQLLEEAKRTLTYGVFTRVGETENMVVESPGIIGCIALYQKRFLEGHFKLVFNDKEIQPIISLLKQTKALI
jgi:hypothetical protein